MQRFKSLARALRTSAFLRQNAIFLVGSLLVGFVNYLYYPVMARLLEPIAYGEVQAVVALFLQMTIFLTVLTQVTVNVVTNYKDEAHKQRVVFELERLACMVSVGIFVIGAMLSWRMQRFFQFDSAWPFVLLLVVFVSSVPLAFRSAFLRAHQRFGRVSVANLLGAIGRIIFSTVFVLAGWKAAGAVGGLLAAQLAAFAYAATEARKLGFAKPANIRYFSKPSLKLIAPELQYALFVLVATMVVTLLTSIDVFVAKHYFPPAIAGEYAGVSTVARTIFFVLSPIALVLLPAVRMHKPAAENRRLLGKSLALTLIIGVPGTMICAIAPRMVTKTLMGANYLPYVHLLPIVSIAMLLIAVLNVIISYYIALRLYQVSYIICASIGGAVVLMGARHGSLQDIAMNLVYSSAGTLLLIAVWRIARLYKR